MKSLFKFLSPSVLLIVCTNCMCVTTRLVLAQAIRVCGSFLGSELKCLGIHSWVHKRDIESHKERERALTSPLGVPSVAPRRHPIPLTLGGTQTQRGRRKETKMM